MSNGRGGGGFDLGGYVDVATRIAEFREKHPEGSLRPADPKEPFRVIELGGATFIVYTAAAYRDRDDHRPGIGVAWEPFPGKTPYTRDSELQNAETSAWGRAIVASLAADTRAGSVASREEVRNRREQSEPAGYEGPTLADRESVETFKAMVQAASEDLRGAMNAWWKDTVGAGWPTEANLDDAHAEFARLRGLGGLPEAPPDAPEGPQTAPEEAPEAPVAEKPAVDPYEGYKKADLQAAARLHHLDAAGATVEQLRAMLDLTAEVLVCDLCEKAGTITTTEGIIYCPDHEPW